MNIRCNNCLTVLNINENKYNQSSIIVQCPKCSQKLRVQLPEKVYVVKSIEADTYVSKPDYKMKKSDTNIIDMLLLTVFFFCFMYMMYDKLL